MILESADIGWVEIDKLEYALRSFCLDCGLENDWITGYEIAFLRDPSVADDLV